MKSFSNLTKLLLISATFFITCSEDILEVFIPNIANQWESSRGSFFFFSPAQTDVSESTFTGNEQNGTTDDFTGKFKNYDIEFTFSNGNESGVRYIGKFVKNSNPLKIDVKGANGVRLILTQN